MVLWHIVIVIMDLFWLYVCVIIIIYLFLNLCQRLVRVLCLCCLSYIACLDHRGTCWHMHLTHMLSPTHTHLHTHTHTQYIYTCMFTSVCSFFAAIHAVHVYMLGSLYYVTSLCCHLYMLLFHL